MLGSAQAALQGEVVEEVRWAGEDITVPHRTGWEVDVQREQAHHGIQSCGRGDWGCHGHDDLGESHGHDEEEVSHGYDDWGAASRGCGGADVEASHEGSACGGAAHAPVCEAEEFRGRG